MNYLIAFISIILGAVAQCLLKMGTEKLKLIKFIDPNSFVKSVILNPSLLCGLFFYAISMLFWLFVLSKMELSKAYPMVSLGYIVTLFLGFLFFNEPMSLSKVTGIALIIIGVYFVAR